MKVGERMRRLADMSGKTQQQIADEMGVTRSLLIYYFAQDKPPKDSKLIRFCEVVGCSLSQVVEGSLENPRIPIYGSISCGIPMSAITDITGYEEVSRDTYKNPTEYFALRMKGMSMFPRMKTGDVVIFHKQSTADNGDIVAVFVGGDDATCKQLVLEDEKVILHPLNDCFGDMVFTEKQMRELPVEIIGKAVELRSRL